MKKYSQIIIILSFGRNVETKTSESKNVKL